jgi:hypothetical protein
LVNACRLQFVVHPGFLQDFVSASNTARVAVDSANFREFEASTPAQITASSRNFPLHSNPVSCHSISSAASVFAQPSAKAFALFRTSIG